MSGPKTVVYENLVIPYKSSYKQLCSVHI